MYMFHIWHMHHNMYTLTLFLLWPHGYIFLGLEAETLKCVLKQAKRAQWFNRMDKQNGAERIHYWYLKKQKYKSWTKSNMFVVSVIKF